MRKIVFTLVVLGLAFMVSAEPAAAKFNLEKLLIKSTVRPSARPRPSVSPLPSGQLVRSAAPEQLKVVILKYVETMERQLTHLLEQVKSSTRLSEEQRNQAEKEINEALKTVGEYKTKVEKAGSQEELRNLAKEMKEYWAKKRPRMADYVSVGQVGAAEQLVARLQKWHGELKGKVDQLGDSDSRKGEFQNKLKSAEKYLEEAKKQIELVKKDLEQGKKIEAREKVRRTFSLLRLALKDLKSVFTGLRKDVKASPSPGATSYVCPDKAGWVDCMPGPGPGKPNCEPDYIKWATKNCPNFKVAY